MQFLKAKKILKKKSEDNHKTVRDLPLNNLNNYTRESGNRRKVRSTKLYGCPISFLAGLPSSFNEAICCKENYYWQKAMEDEINSFDKIEM
jgi:hypothetical protein